MEEKIRLINYGDYQAKWKPEQKPSLKSLRPSLKELKSGWEYYKKEQTELKQANLQFLKNMPVI